MGRVARTTGYPPRRGPLRLDTSGIYALGIPAYVALVLAEVAWTRRHAPGAYGFADTFSNLSGGLGELLLGLFLGPHLVGLYQWASGFSLFTWGTDRTSVIACWIVAFLASDLCYYVYHRTGHRVRLLWCIHGVHHQSDKFNLTIAVRHPWFSDVYSAPFYALVPLLGVSSTRFFVAISAISFYAFIVHTRFRMVRPLPGLVTPITHIVHHCRNTRYVGRNLGAMFTFWDRLFGTHVELTPDDPPRVGVAGGTRTWNGAAAQWIFFAEMLHLARQTSNLRDRLRVVFGSPGWVPPGATPLSVTPPSELVGNWARAHVLTQFTVMTAWAAYILWLRDTHPLPVQLLSVIVLFVGLVGIGAVLDGARRAWAIDGVRLGALLALGGWRAAAGDSAGAWLMGGAALGVGTLWLARREGVASPA